MKYFLALTALLILNTSQALAEEGSPPTAKFESVTLANPLNVTSIEGLLVAILNIIVVLMIPIIVFFIIMAGFKYVTARGNATQIQEATMALTYAIIGGVLVLGASAIAALIKSTVEAF